MAAAQPFISGAISKTVNGNVISTVEEIQHTFVEGWRMGLKCVAIYSVGSKSSPHGQRPADHLADFDDRQPVGRAQLTVTNDPALVWGGAGATPTLLNLGMFTKGDTPPGSSTRM